MYTLNSDQIATLLNCKVQGYVVTSLLRHMLTGNTEITTSYITLWFQDEANKTTYHNYLLSVVSKLFDLTDIKISTKLSTYNSELRTLIIFTLEEKSLVVTLIVNNSNPYKIFTIDNVVYNLMTQSFSYAPTVNLPFTSDDELKFRAHMANKCLYLNPDLSIDHMPRSAELVKLGYVIHEAEKPVQCVDKKTELVELTFKMREAKLVYMEIKKKHQELVESML